MHIITKGRKDLPEGKEGSNVITEGRKDYYNERKEGLL